MDNLVTNSMPAGAQPGRVKSILAAWGDAWPIAISVIPFGIVCGIGAVKAGMTAPQGIGISLALFAGASQIAVNEFLANDVPWPLIVIAALTINLRFLLFSAALAPQFARLAAWKKVILSYLLVDQVYALGVNAWDRADRPVLKTWYYLGVMFLLFPAFQGGNVAGIYLGAQVPKEWGFEFSVPLIFLAILVPAIKSKALAIAAAVAAVLTVALSFLPYMLGMFIAALAAIGVGYYYQEVAGHGR